MHGLRRHRTAILVILAVFLTWCSLFIAYDYRSPVNQVFRGFGTLHLEGWGAGELDAVCIRLEAPAAAPSAAADKAVAIAVTAFPKAYVREAVLASYSDTCSGAGPRLVWAVSLIWPVSTYLTADPPPRPRAVAIVDAMGGGLIKSYAEGRPQGR
jgi:hypothetical protein